MMISSLFPERLARKGAAVAPEAFLTVLLLTLLLPLFLTPNALAETPALQATSEKAIAAPQTSAIDPCSPEGPTLELVSPDGVDELDRENGFSDRQLPRIEERPVFSLGFNCPIDPASVSTSVHFVAEGIKERIQVDLLKGAELDDALCSIANHQRSSKVILVRPRMAFPSNVEVSLVVGNGLRSSSGFRTKEPQTVRYRVRPEFSVFARCEHTYASGACDPWLPVYLVLTNAASSGSWSSMGGAVDALPLIEANGERVVGQASSFFDGDTNLPAIKFLPPFKPNSKASIPIPEGFQDVAGRKLGVPIPELSVSIGAIPPMVRFSSTFGVVESRGNGMLPVTVRNIEPKILLSSATAVGGPAAGSALPALVSVTKEPAQVLTWLNAVQGRYAKIESNTASIFDANSLPEISPNGISKIVPAPVSAIAKLELPKPSGGSPFEVVGIPLSKPGFYVVEVESRVMGEALKGSGKSIFFPTTALVTDMAISFKWGRESSVAWVTSLNDATPIAGATVQITDCNGKQLATAVSDATGQARFGSLPVQTQVPTCGEWPLQPMALPGVKYPSLSIQTLVVSASKGDDFSFVLSNWSEGIEPWRYGVNYDYGWSPSEVKFRTVAARSLLRRGERAGFKIFARRQTVDGFAAVAAEALPTQIVLVHAGSGEEIPLELSGGAMDVASSSGTAEWLIPANAKLGDYSIRYRTPLGDTYGESGLISVLDYRVPLAKGVINVSTPEIFSGTPVPSVPVNLSVSYLAGGAASNLPVTLRYQVQPKDFEFGGRFEGFLFGRDEEIQLPSESGYSGEEAAPTPSPSRRTRAVVRSVEGTLSDAGALRVTLADLPQIERPSNLFMELEYRDPNGEVQTASQSVPYLPSPWLVGIKTLDWANLQQGFSFDVGVVSGTGKPIASAPVTVTVFSREVYSHRKKLVGATFGYDNQVQDADIGVICRGTTDSTGILRCRADMQVAGTLVLEASAVDSAGRVSKTAQQVYVGGDPANWFAQSESDRIDFVPEKERYEPGETARFHVKTPFKRATALITVEREGVIESFVREIERSNPVVELPVKGNYAPNVVVSALLVRGRIGEAKPTATFDAGKPAFKLGMGGIKVGLKEFELKVGVSTDQTVYQTRGEAKVSLAVRTASGAKLPPGASVAVSVVDLGLLQLKDNPSVNLLESMMELRPTSVQTAVLMGYVIGKRHYGLKALPFGGGGGAALTRELFDTLLYWNPNVVVDANGNAEIKVPLNDSITSFRVTAVASAGTALFGTGIAEFRTIKDFTLFAGPPPTARSGDTLEVDFTAQNNSGTDAILSVKLDATVDGGDSPVGVVAIQPSERIAVAAGSSRMFSWRLTVPGGTKGLRYRAELTVDDKVRDSMAVKQVVSPAQPATVLAARFGQVVNGKFSTDAQLTSAEAGVADGATVMPGSTSAAVTLSASIADLTGVKRYMADYPFLCLEQKVSKAVALDDGGMWEQIVSDLPNYLDSSGFLKFFPPEANGYDVLTAYVLSAAAADGRELPAQPRAQMIEALKRLISGKSVRRFALPIEQRAGFVKGRELSFEQVELNARKIAAMEAVSRYRAESNGPTEAEVNTVWRALKELPTAALVNLLMVVNRSPELSRINERRAELGKILDSRLVVTGARAQFSDEEDEFYWQLTSGDLTVVKYAAALLEIPKRTAAQERLLPKLIQGAIARQRNGHWDLTLANVWGAVALKEFAKQFERDTVAGNSAVSVESAKSRGPGDSASKTISVRWDNGVPVAEPSTPIRLGLSDGEGATLRVDHTGSGKPWVNVLVSAARTLTKPTGPGYTIRKVIRPIKQKVAGSWSVGDLVEVELTVDAKGGFPWVVVDDPVPTGATILGSGLKNQSALNAAPEAAVSWEDPGAWLAYEERSFTNYRAYFSWLAKGEHKITYRLRLNGSGSFMMPVTRAEAMYVPEYFGEAPNEAIVVGR